MTRHCGRWYLAALLLLLADGRLMLVLESGGVPERALHLLLLAALGFTLSRAAGRRNWALAVCAWWSATLQWHLAFVPGHEVGVNVWLPDLLAALIGAWLPARSVRVVPKSAEVGPVAVLSEYSR